jgi:hypothetical protein
MSKLDDFKSFVASKPELSSYVKNGQMTWQKFYELYDLYGTDDRVWKDYSSIGDNNLNKIKDMIKNVDMESIKEHINTAQKALDIVQELTGKSTSTSSIVTTPRPLNKFFED